MGKAYSYVHTRRTADKGRSSADKALRSLGEYSLCATHPHLAAEWHPHKNGVWTPDQFLPGSQTRVWWRCRKDKEHCWRTKIGDRVFHETGCPYCAHRLPSTEYNLLRLHPRVASEWHPRKNGAQSPDRVLPASRKKVWWQCSVNRRHEWQATISNRTGRCSGCPYCSGRRPSTANRLSKRYPLIAEQWHPEKNGGLTPDDLSYGSRKKVWWQCQSDGAHVWRASVVDRTTGNTGCPFCAGKRVDITNSLATLYPDVAGEWHPTKNGSVSPGDVTPGSQQKFWWLCRNNPGHAWMTSPGSRMHKSSGCPYCSGRRASAERNLLRMHPQIASEWHTVRNGEFHPDQCAPKSSRLVWWQCKVNRRHVWQDTVKHRTVMNCGCPYCSGRKVSRSNRLSSRFPRVAAQWHPTKNGDLTPDAVSYGSHKKAWWQCSSHRSHVWLASISHRTLSNSGCPNCAGRTPQKAGN